MSQIGLHGLDIIPAFNGSHGITMSEVLKAGFFIAQGSCDISISNDITNTNATVDVLSVCGGVFAVC